MYSKPLVPTSQPSQQYNLSTSGFSAKKGIAPTASFLPPRIPDKGGYLLQTPTQKLQGDDQNTKRAALFQISGKTPFMTAYDEPNRNKKRDYTEFKLPYQLPQRTPNRDQVDDNSTLKPNQHTIVRNPTMNTLGFGQNREPRGRPNIRPLNLTQNNTFGPGDITDVDGDDFYSLRDAGSIFPQSFLRQSTLEDLNEKQSSQAVESITTILDELTYIEQDPTIQDISRTNSKGLLYEMAPFQFMISSQFKIPNLILKDIQKEKYNPNCIFDCGFLKPLKVIYICLGKTLYLWAYDRTQPSLDTRRMRTSAFSQQAFKQEFDQKITTVQLASPFKSQNLHYKDEKVLIVATASQVQVFELIVREQDGQISLAEMGLSTAIDSDKMMTNIVQLNKNGRVFYGAYDGRVHELTMEDNSNSILRALVSENRRLKHNDLNEKSLFQKLIPSFLKFEDTKVVVDLKLDSSRNVLYSLSMSQTGSTDSQMVIEIFDLGVLADAKKKLTSIRQHELVKAIYKFNGQKDLLRGQNLYEISKPFKIMFITPIMFNESKNFHLMIVTKNGMRIYISFEQVEVAEPTRADLERTQQQGHLLILERFTHNWEIAEIMRFPQEAGAMDANVMNSINSGLFRVHPLNYFEVAMILDNNAMSYNCENSLLIYGQNKQRQGVEDFNPDEPLQGLTFNFIKKNESAFTHFKQLNLNKQNATNFSFAEQYTVLQLIIEPTSKPQPPRNYSLQDQLDEPTEILDNEILLEINSGTPQAHPDILNLLGLTKDHLDKKQAESTCFYNLMSLSDFEKQVYLQPNKMAILTDQRIIEIVQMRPIDYLVNILHSLVRSSIEQNYDDFEDFVDQYSVREVSAMLVQILCEPQTQYVFSRRIEQTLHSNKQRRRLPLSQPRQSIRKDYTLGTMSRGSFYGGAPLNMSNYKAKPANVSSMYMGNTTYQNNQYQASTVGLEYTYQRTTTDMRQIALELLIVFGDSMPISTNEDLQFSLMENFPISNQQFSYKHQGLYLYLQRILRPIWETKLTYQPDMYSAVIMPTFESLDVVRSKLEGLHTLIVKDHLLLYGLNQKTQYQVENYVLRNQFKMLSQFDPKFLDRLEAFEKQSLTNLKHFTSRCLEVVEVLDILTFDGNVDSFIRMQKLLTKDLFEQLANLKFQDLATQQYNGLIRKILEASVQVKTNTCDQQVLEKLRIRAQRIKRVCRQLFSNSEANTFVGESLLQTAINETNSLRKEELIKQGIESLIQEPMKIDFQTVVPLFLETGNYTTLVDICLRKARAVESLDPAQRQINSVEQVELMNECYEVILALFAAIDCSITNTKLGNKIDNVKVHDIQDLCFKKVESIPRLEQKIMLRNRIINRIEQFDNQILLSTLFNYLLAHPRDQLQIDSMPRIDNTKFERICDSYIQGNTMKKDSFDSLIKLMIKHQESERLARLVLNMVTDVFFLHNQQDEVIKVSTDQKLSYLLMASQQLNGTQTKLDAEEFIRLQKELSDCENALKYQINVIESLRNKEAILNHYLKDGDRKNDDKRKKTKQEISDLREADRKIESKLFTLQELFEHFIVKLNLHDMKIKLLISQPNSRLQNQNVMSDKLKEAFEAYMEFLLEYQPKVWQIEVTNLLTEIFSKNPNKNILKPILRIVDSYNDKTYNTSILVSDIRKILDGYNLQGTKFWLQEYCFDQETLQLTPSEILYLFVPQYDGFKQGNIQHQKIDSNKFAKILACLALWLRTNKSLFPANQTVNVNSVSQMLQSQGRNEEFVRDLKLSGLNVWTKIIKGDLEKFLSNNKLTLTKDLSTALEALFNKVQKESEGMCVQHGVDLARPQNGFPIPQRAQTFANSMNQSYVSRFNEPAQTSMNTSRILPAQDLDQTFLRADQPSAFSNQVVSPQQPEPKLRNKSGFREISQGKIATSFRSGTGINSDLIQPPMEDDAMDMVDPRDQAQLAQNRSASLTAKRNANRQQNNMS